MGLHLCNTCKHSYESIDDKDRCRISGELTMYSERKQCHMYERSCRHA
jgi:hypothetical protein